MIFLELPTENLDGEIEETYIVPWEVVSIQRYDDGSNQTIIGLRGGTTVFVAMTPKEVLAKVQWALDEQTRREAELIGRGTYTIEPRIK